MNPLYPFTGKYLDINGQRMHYLDEGTGEPLVMVHGNPTWSFYFRNPVNAFRDTHRVIVPDHIGCGLSDKPPADKYPYILERRVQDLETLLEHCQPGQPVTLILHDWGGMIGMAYAHRHPEKIRRLVLLNTAAFLLPEGKRLPWSLWLVRNTPLGSLLVRGLNQFSRGAVRYCAMKPLSPEIKAGYLQPYDSWANRVAVLRFVRDIPLHPSDDSYALVKEVQDHLDQFRQTPTLICWGEKDFVFGAPFLEQWRRHLPDAEVHTFAEAGHFVLEDAGEEIIAHIRRFLAES